MTRPGSDGSTSVVAEWVEGHADDASPVSGEELVDLREMLERVAADTAAGAEGNGPTGDEPWRVGKARLADLTRCERLARTDRAGADLSPGIVRGVALDHFIAHRLWVGPVTAPAEELTSMAVATADHDLETFLESFGDDELDEMLAPLAAAAEAWSGLDASWWPRVQTSASLVLADGAVVSAGRVDVELGGPLTGRPSLVVEVKSSTGVRADHAAEAYLYALLVALRDDEAPVAVALWYPGGAVVDFPVAAGTLRAAAARLADGIVTWSELVAGRPPRESPGAWCRWCPDADRCPSVQVDVSSGGPDDDRPAFDDGPRNDDGRGRVG